MVVGARVDPLFGPLVVVGLGGILVELLEDTALAPAPVTHDEALALLAQLKGARLLDGFRGMPAVDRNRLAEVICRVPCVCRRSPRRNCRAGCQSAYLSDNITAVDALIVMAQKENLTSIRGKSTRDAQMVPCGSPIVDLLSACFA